MSHDQPNSKTSTPHTRGTRDNSGFEAVLPLLETPPSTKQFLGWEIKNGTAPGYRSRGSQASPGTPRPDRTHHSLPSKWEAPRSVQAGQSPEETGRKNQSHLSRWDFFQGLGRAIPSFVQPPRIFHKEERWVTTVFPLLTRPGHLLWNCLPRKSQRASKASSAM